jgi:cytosine/adenosine deaminase-related metal-dependent hydrolase
VSTQPGFWLDDVLVETAIVPDADRGARTITERAAVRIDGGVFAEVRLGEQAPTGGVDGGGLLLLPSLRDTHIHLDKTFYGGPWRAPAGTRSWLEEEERLLPEMSRNIPVRSNAILDLLISNGTTRVVAHCNVDHVIGTQNIVRLLDVLRARDDIDWDVVAYPQHGMRQGTITPLLDEALNAGATMVGGLDPGSREHDVNGTLDGLFQLAARHDADIDLHLHDPGTLGRYEMERLAELTIANRWHGRVSLSCASALAAADGAGVRGTIDRLAEARIRVGATMGVNGSTIPIRLLDDAGIEISLGSDSIMDILTPFGQGDILEQLWILAQKYGWYDETSIARTLHLGAGAPARWADDNTRKWPAAGDSADFMLLPATCSAEAIARRVRRKAVYRRGKQIWPKPEKEL